MAYYIKSKAKWNQSPAKGFSSVRYYYVRVDYYYYIHTSYIHIYKGAHKRTCFYLPFIPPPHFFARNFSISLLAAFLSHRALNDMIDIYIILSSCQHWMYITNNIGIILFCVCIFDLHQIDLDYRVTATALIRFWWLYLHSAVPIYGICLEAFYNGGGLYLKGETANNRVTNNGRVCVCAYIEFSARPFGFKQYCCFCFSDVFVTTFLFVFYTYTNLHNATDATVIGRDFYLSDDDETEVGWRGACARAFTFSLYPTTVCLWFGWNRTTKPFSR